VVDDSALEEFVLVILVRLGEGVQVLSLDIEGVQLMLLHRSVLDLIHLVELLLEEHEVLCFL
jgi:hypothetical protein